ncbi:uncharacterized protein HMPREF1541_05438 [Cyphellophora europaea CBS 101466]|uniref:Myb-like DNA-binding domain-containing protein n=1 Tax=Cyphellophora europaea (strain CBS 101466) TaxID=1220924 RepID=W2RSC2_CYPE1|nr:uncharacterized protein HMPREF1541_05438 [Cyphellophora europaea CBS 101466]ETN39215.1 hypothetical protein HMPREF1541_05438 [Cyphellophora europaea CBS 101466]
MTSTTKRSTTKSQATPESQTQFLYLILKQLDLKTVNWQEVADGIGIKNGHAARMRWSRFKAQTEGLPTQNTKKKKKDSEKNSGKESSKRANGMGGGLQEAMMDERDEKRVKMEHGYSGGPIPYPPSWGGCSGMPPFMGLPHMIKHEPDAHIKMESGGEMFFAHQPFGPWVGPPPPMPGQMMPPPSMSANITPADIFATNGHASNTDPDDLPIKHGQLGVPATLSMADLQMPRASVCLTNPAEMSVEATASPNIAQTAEIPANTLFHAIGPSQEKPASTNQKRHSPSLHSIPLHQPGPDSPPSSTSDDANQATSSQQQKQNSPPPSYEASQHPNPQQQQQQQQPHSFSAQQFSLPYNFPTMPMQQRPSYTYPPNMPMSMSGPMSMPMNMSMNSTFPQSYGYPDPASQHTMHPYPPPTYPGTAPFDPSGGMQPMQMQQMHGFAGFGAPFSGVSPHQLQLQLQHPQQMTPVGPVVPPFDGFAAEMEVDQPAFAAVGGSDSGGGGAGNPAGAIEAEATSSAAAAAPNPAAAAAASAPGPGGGTLWEGGLGVGGKKPIGGTAAEGEEREKQEQEQSGDQGAQVAGREAQGGSANGSGEEVVGGSVPPQPQFVVMKETGEEVGLKEGASCVAE